ncbi:hypothetical protein HG530_007713 [Fusarium avenaceum]|nr:hypothetical protein HG530_007713 [Fusarium avenaceum]
MSSRPRTQPTRRIERSCAVCHRRKVRCNKTLPCSHCIRSGFECTYPPTGPIVRRAKKTTINDVASRISHMEKTIEAFKASQVAASQPSESVSSLTPTNTSIATPPTTFNGGELRESVPRSNATERNRDEGLLLNKGRFSHYVNEVLLSRVIQQEDDVRTALATPRDEPPREANSPASPFNPMGLLSAKLSFASLSSFHPPRKIAIHLWKVFVDVVDPCTKVTHIPTSETIVYTVASDPSKATAENLGLCFAIFYASITALTPEEVFGVTGEDKKEVLHRYRVCLEQSLTHADFLDNPTLTLVQALAICSAAMRIHNTGRAVWIMNGITLRAAQSIGLHRDGSKLGLPPFESEIRRRVWWHFLERDSRGAEDYGLQNPSSSSVISVEQPRNLHDSDLFPGMKELPPSRPDWTRMTLPLCNTQVSRAWARLSQMICSEDGIPSEDVRKQVFEDAMSKVEAILQRCNPVIPEQRMTIRISQLVLRKVDVVSRRQWQTLRQSDNQQSLATESDVVEAVELLEHANMMWQDDDMVPFRWIAQAFPQYHMMLYILRHLCVSPRGPSAARAFAAVEEHLENFKSCGSGPLSGLKWTVLTTLRDRAFLLMQRVEREGAGGQVGQGNHLQMGMGSSDAGEIQDKIEGDFNMPDWNTILEEFPLEMEDFSLIF